MGVIAVLANILIPLAPKIFDAANKIFINPKEGVNKKDLATQTFRAIIEKVIASGVIPEIKALPKLTDEEIGTFVETLFQLFKSNGEKPELTLARSPNECFYVIKGTITQLKEI